MKPSRFLPVILAGLALSWAGSASAYKPGVLRELGTEGGGAERAAGGAGLDAVHDGSLKVMRTYRAPCGASRK